MTDDSTTDSTTDTLSAYVRLADPFGAVVDRLAAADWDAPSPCEGWSAGDVLDHVVSTQRGFLAEHGVDVGGAAAESPAARWHDHDARMRDLLADPAVAGLEYDGVFGRTSVGASIVTFYGFDLVVHRWDLAAAGGLDERLTDEELALLERSADGFGEHLYDDGVCKPAVPVAAGAGRQERLLARLGRRVPAPA